jgi:uncharacterized protein (DUF1697 family)
VKTVLSSGNVVFTAREASEASLERRAEAAITHHLGTAFLTVIRPIEALRERSRRTCSRSSRRATRISAGLRELSRMTEEFGGYDPELK